MALRFDEIGYWSEIKLEIIKEYARAYSTILSAQRALTHVYIDGFSGAGEHRSKLSKQMVPGSPLNALHVTPPFREYHLIDLNREKTEHLKGLVGERGDVSIYNRDCNEVLVNEILPTIEYRRYRRALCILDPYGLHLNWEVMRMAGQSRVIDMFLNFPVMDMNMNVLWQKEANADDEQTRRMDAFWGDSSWRSTIYRNEISPLFGDIGLTAKAPNHEVAEAFRQRLKTVAGFGHVPEPLPMTNTSHAVVYYLFFASQKDVANKIVKEIFDKWRGRLN